MISKANIIIDYNDENNLLNSINKKYFNGNENINFNNNYNKIWNAIIHNKQSVIYGAVQSGKTKYIVKLAFQSLFTKHFDVVFYLSGSTNSLHKQNLEDFKYFRNESNLDTLILDEDKFCCGIERNSIVLLKKNDSIINLLNDMKSCANCSRNNLRTLIIDDECDFATPYKKGKDAAINKKVHDYIKSNATNALYIGVSGTPFINLSKDQNLRPEYVIVLENDPEYQGISFYSNNTFYEEITNDPAKDMYEVINDYIKYNNTQKKKSQMLVSIDKLIKYNKENFSYINNYIKSMDENEFIDEKRPKVQNWISTNEEKLSQVSDFSINIGDMMLGRGMRMNHLSHVLIRSSVKEFNPATYIQKARWFGYGKNIQKIYCNNDLIEFYTILAPEFDKFMRNLFNNDPLVSDEKIDKINLYLKNQPKLNIIGMSNAV